MGKGKLKAKTWTKCARIYNALLWRGFHPADQQIKWTSPAHIMLSRSSKDTLPHFCHLRLIFSLIAIYYGKKQDQCIHNSHTARHPQIIFCPVSTHPTSCFFMPYLTGIHHSISYFAHEQTTIQLTVTMCDGYSYWTFPKHQKDIIFSTTHLALPCGSVCEHNQI